MGKQKGSKKKMKATAKTDALNKKVKKLISIQQEHKYFNVLVTPVVGTTWVLNPFTLIPQTNTDIGRSGDRLHMTNVRLRATIIKDPDSDQLQDYVRIVVFQWRPNNGTVGGIPPTPGQIFLDEPGLGTPTIRSFYSHDTRRQYSILWDKTYTLSGGSLLAASVSASYTDSLVRYLNTSIPLKKAAKDIQFIAGSTDGDHHLYVATCGTDAPGSANPAVRLNFKTDFTDS